MWPPFTQVLVADATEKSSRFQHILMTHLSVEYQAEYQKENFARPDLPRFSGQRMWESAQLQWPD
jgi:hypothetical protein